MTSCLNNMNPLGRGFMLYTDDGDEGLPGGAPWTSGRNKDYPMYNFREGIESPSPRSLLKRSDGTAL